MDHRSRYDRDRDRLSVSIAIAVFFCVVSFSAGLVSPARGQTPEGPEPAASATTPTDPFQIVLQRAVEAMDESYDSWNFRPEETVDSTNFTINYIASLSTDGQRRLDRVMILHADPNQDRLVTREEAIRFLETQLGIRWVNQDPLRLAEGRVVDFAAFLRADRDQDDAISPQEFAVAPWNNDGTKVDFTSLDANHDGLLSVSEYASADGPNLLDLRTWFQQADRDRDEKLDENELAASLPINRQHLISSNLHAFDDDGDRRLSWNEYQLSMIGNFNYPWDSLPQDKDHDDALTFEEFSFHPRDLFQLQKRYYFHRLDRNGDQRLTMDEFSFEKQPSMSLFRITANGEEIDKIYASPRFPILGGPSVSADGHTILFHVIPPQGEHKALIVQISHDGGETREIGHGLMPSWAPSGSLFACSRYEGGAGVWIMRTDGNADQRIDDGWGAVWSPDGRSIAYTNDNSVRIFDVSSRTSRVALAKSEHPYRYLNPSLAWSPDSRRLSFQGVSDGGVDIAWMNVGEAASHVRFRAVESLSADMAWTVDGQSLLFSMHSPRYGRRLIHKLLVDSEEPPTIFAEAGTATTWSDLGISPNGEFVVAVAVE